MYLYVRIFFQSRLHVFIRLSGPVWIGYAASGQKRNIWMSKQTHRREAQHHANNCVNAQLTKTGARLAEPVGAKSAYEQEKSKKNPARWQERS